MSSQEIMELAFTAILVLIAGMVLMKLGGWVRKGKKEPKKSTYFKNNMKDRQNKL